MTDHEAETPIPPDAPEIDPVAGAADPLLQPAELECEPAYAPPSLMPRRSRLSQASLVGTVVCAGTLMAVTAHRDPLLRVEGAREAGEVARFEDPAAVQRLSRAYQLMGPPNLAPQPSAPNAVASGASQMASAATGLPGRIGYLGPIDGPLDASLAEGPVRGPLWQGAPLPGIGSFGFPTEPPAAQGAADVPKIPAGQVGSELPDLDKLALARLANPHFGGAQSAAPRGGAGEVSAEKPLTVRLSVARPARGYEPGATVAVRGSTSQDAFFVLIGVDGEGNAATLFRSSAPARSFGYAIRAQTSPGPQYLVAVAAAQPLTGPDVAAAMRASGQGFLAPVATIGTAAAQPGAAWGAAVSQAASLGGPARGWKRHEWAVATSSFFTRPPEKVAVQKPAAEKPSGARPEPVKPQESDGSVLPGAAKPEPQGEKPALPVVKPDSAQPKPPMAPPEPAKPARGDGAGAQTQK